MLYYRLFVGYLALLLAGCANVSEQSRDKAGLSSCGKGQCYTMLLTDNKADNSNHRAMRFTVPADFLAKNAKINKVRDIQFFSVMHSESLKLQTKGKISSVVMESRQGYSQLQTYVMVIPIIDSRSDSRLINRRIYKALKVNFDKKAVNKIEVLDTQVKKDNNHCITNYMKIKCYFAQGDDYLLETETICPMGVYNLKIQSIASAQRLAKIDSLLNETVKNENTIKTSIKIINYNS